MPSRASYIGVLFFPDQHVLTLNWECRESFFWYLLRLVLPPHGLTTDGVNIPTVL